MTGPSSLAKDGVHPDVEITNTILVEIHRPQPEVPRRVFRDDGTARAFQEWTLRRQIYPITGGAAGPGFYQGVFSVEDGLLIREYFDGYGPP